MNKPRLSFADLSCFCVYFFISYVRLRRKNQNKFPYSQQNFPIYSILGFILTNFCCMIHERNKQYSMFLADTTLKIYTHILQFFFFIPQHPREIVKNWYFRNVAVLFFRTEKKKIEKSLQVGNGSKTFF